MPPAAPSAAESPAPATAGAGSFVRGALGTGVGVGARALGSLVLSKLLAVYGGPGGLTLLAQFQNLLGLLAAVPNEGVQVGLVKYLAPLRPGSARYRAWLGAALALYALAGGLGWALWASLERPGPGYALVFGLGLAGLLGQSLLTTALLAAGHRRAYVLLLVGLSVVGPGAVAAALALGQPLPRVLLTYLLGQATMLLPALGFAHHYHLGPSPRWRRPSPVAARLLARYVLMALATLLSSRALDYGLRQVLVQRYGLGATDLWQAAVRLSDLYTMGFAAVMSSVFYPRAAALVGQAPALRRYVRSVLVLLAVGLGVGLGLLWLARPWLLPLLFAERLRPAQALLGPQLLGDWAKFLSWPLLLLLPLRAQVGRYVAVQLISGLVYAGLLAALLPRYGLGGATLAYAARHLLLLLACVAYFRAFWWPAPNFAAS